MLEIEAMIHNAYVVEQQQMIRGITVPIVIYSN